MSTQLRRARLPAIFVLAIVAAFLSWKITSIEQRHATAAMTDLLPTPAEVGTALLRVGLDPQALAAAGVTPGAASGVVADAAEHLTSDAAALALADSAFAQARGECDTLRRIIQSGRATPQQLAAYQAAKLQRQQAQAQREELLQQLFDDATAGITNAQRGALATIRGNRDWGLPVEFLVVDRAEAQWIELRDCLANESIAQEYGEDPDPQAQAFLAEARSNPFVALAGANLQTSLDLVSSAWEQAAGQ